MSILAGSILARQLFNHGCEAEITYPSFKKLITDKVKTTLVLSGEDVWISLVSSGEDVWTPLVSSVFFQKFPDVRRDQKQTKVWGAKKDVEEDKNWTAGAGATKRKWEDEDHQWKGESKKDDKWGKKKDEKWASGWNIPLLSSVI